MLAWIADEFAQQLVLGEQNVLERMRREKAVLDDEERDLSRLRRPPRDGREVGGLLRVAREEDPQPVSATPMTSSWPAWMLSAWLVSARAPTWNTAGRRLPAMT